MKASHQQFVGDRVEERPTSVRCRSQRPAARRARPSRAYGEHQQRAFPRPEISR